MVLLRTSFLRSSWTGYNVICHSTDAWPRFEAQLSTLATLSLGPILSIPETVHRLKVHQDSDRANYISPNYPQSSCPSESHSIKLS